MSRHLKCFDRPICTLIVCPPFVIELDHDFYDSVTQPLPLSLSPCSPDIAVARSVLRDCLSDVEKLSQQYSDK